MKHDQEKIPELRCRTVLITSPKMHWRRDSSVVLLWLLQFAVVISVSETVVSLPRLLHEWLVVHGTTIFRMYFVGICRSNLSSGTRRELFWLS